MAWIIILLYYYIQDYKFFATESDFDGSGVKKNDEIINEVGVGLKINSFSRENDRNRIGYRRFFAGKWGPTFLRRPRFRRGGFLHRDGRAGDDGVEVVGDAVGRQEDDVAGVDERNRARQVLELGVATPVHRAEGAAGVADVARDVEIARPRRDLPHAVAPAAHEREAVADGDDADGVAPAGGGSAGGGAQRHHQGGADGGEAGAAPHDLGVRRVERVQQEGERSLEQPDTSYSGRESAAWNSRTRHTAGGKESATWKSQGDGHAARRREREAWKSQGEGHAARRRESEAWKSQGEGHAACRRESEAWKSQCEGHAARRRESEAWKSQGQQQVAGELYEFSAN